MKKLAVVTSHPIQYNAPWFRHLAARGDLDLRVFYLWDFGVEKRFDPGFGREVLWDVPLLGGYAHEIVPNTSPDPGTHHFTGLRNPTLGARVAAFDPDAVLLLTYNYLSTHRFLWTWDRRRAPLLFRGDSHRLDPARRAEPLRRAFIALTLSRFDGFLYVGEANRRYFRYHGVPDDKLFFAPHAVDNDRFSAAGARAADDALAFRREQGIPDDHAVVLFAGKLVEKKRPQDLLAAFLDARPEKATLLFVGSGPLEAALRARAEGHASVRFAPFQNQSQMPRTLVAGDLVALVSDVQETWGLIINEAMAVGRAVLVSDHVGCAEDLVRPGENGLVVPARDVPALSRALREALADRARLTRWGEAGRAIVARYGYAQTTEGLTRALGHLERARRQRRRPVEQAPQRGVGS
ncbi:MAG: glycosyltransferase family 4 protein [Byssovorax sp.]